MAESDSVGRCISCGFLSYRASIARLGFEYQEVSPDGRNTPERLYRPPKPKPQAAPRSPYGIPQAPLTDMWNEGFLICFRHKADLPAEMERAQATADSELRQVGVRGILLSDRRCPEYVRYVAGLTPKDHLMERRVSTLEEDRRTFQATIDRSGKRLTWAALILGSILALGQIIAALVAMTPDSYAAKWFQRLWSPPAQTGGK